MVFALNMAENKLPNLGPFGASSLGALETSGLFSVGVDELNLAGIKDAVYRLCVS